MWLDRYDTIFGKIILFLSDFRSGPFDPAVCRVFRNRSGAPNPDRGTGSWPGAFRAGFIRVRPRSGYGLTGTTRNAPTRVPRSPFVENRTGVIAKAWTGNCRFRIQRETAYFIENSPL